MIARHAILPVLLLAHAHARAAADASGGVPKDFGKLVQVGTVFDDVLFPRYDEARRLTGDLKARRITLLGEGRMEGEDIHVVSRNPDQSPLASVHLDKATFTYVEGEDGNASRLMRTEAPVSLHSTKLHTKGQGLIYDIDTGRGFIRGPVHTWAPANPTQTSMNSSVRSIAAAATLGASAVAEPSAQPAPGSATTAPPPSQQLRDDLQASADATREAIDFLTQAEASTKDPANPPAAPATAPIPELEPDADTITIDCDRGMYFDSDAGVFVFLGNVLVDHPSFTLTAQHDAKIFFGKKAPANQPKPGEPARIAIGDAERLVATGAVVLTKKTTPSDSRTMKASGAIFTYHIPSGVGSITGGSPWLFTEQALIRAMQPGLSITVQNRDGVMEARTSPGSWSSKFIVGSEKKLEHP